jgi:hypothetical protein
MPSTWGKTYWRGGYVCGCIIQSVEDIVEPRLRDAGHLGDDEQITIFQHCYSGSVSASAGTHDGGGALDIEKTSDAETVIWRECGGAAWQRGTPEDYYFDDHTHIIWQGCPHLSSGAADQVVDYKNGRDGLADNGPDQSPHVKPITWQDAYDKYIGSTKGLLGMSDVDHFTGAAPQTIARDGKWHTVTLDDEGALSYLSGPKDLYIVVTNLELTGLGVGEVAQVRYVAVTDYPGDKATTIDTKYPISELIGTSGSTFGTPIVWLNNLGKAKDSDGTTKIRLMVLAPAEPTPDDDVLPAPEPCGPITVAKLVARVAY